MNINRNDYGTKNNPAPSNQATFVKADSNGNAVYMEFTKWGVAVKKVNTQGNVIDTWDGKLESMPVRFQ